MITLADVTINPKLDDSWMPDGLPDVVSQAVGTALIVLAILFVVFILAYAANKVFPSMRASWSAYGLFRVLGVMLVVVLTVGTGPTIYWVDHHVDPFPGGVTVSTSEWAATKLDTQLVKQIGVDGASALANTTHDVKKASGEKRAKNSKRAMWLEPWARRPHRRIHGCQPPRTVSEPAFQQFVTGALRTPYPTGGRS
ncbi:MAG: hypothetical protein M3036_02770 [Bifidobacteriales bacterium]|nr:hypothetical protein [Bifidobacteriales bacterium]